jgi:hypothetical protein
MIYRFPRVNINFITKINNVIKEGEIWLRLYLIYLSCNATKFKYARILFIIVVINCVLASYLVCLLFSYDD